MTTFLATLVVMVVSFAPAEAAGAIGGGSIPWPPCSGPSPTVSTAYPTLQWLQPIDANSLPICPT
jgi:hypothetical protein